MINRKLMVVIRCVFLIITLYFLSGCVQAQVDPTIPVGLLSKSRDYLFFCLSTVLKRFIAVFYF